MAGRRKRKIKPVELDPGDGDTLGAAVPVPMPRQRPLLKALLVCLAVFLTWMVATTTLPYALAKRAPELALRLNPNNPAALMVVALKLRDRLFASLKAQLASGAGAGSQTNKPTGQGRNKSGTDNSGAEIGLRGPAPGTSAVLSVAERDRLKVRIRDLAARIIAVDPLSGTAYRLLAEVSDDPAQVRDYMQAAVARSRREAIALFWLINDAFTRKDHAMVITYGDLLLKTQIGLTRFVADYFVQVAENEAGRRALVAKLAAQPNWRRRFFYELPAVARNFATPLAIMIGLKSTKGPVTTDEQQFFQRSLIASNRPEIAYNMALQLMSQAELDKVGLPTNGNFENDPSGSPFDWLSTKAVNAVAEYVPATTEPRGRSLHLRFGSGRVTAPVVSQVVVLVQGRYQISGIVQGRITAKRGLKWQVRCLGGGNRALGQSQMLLGLSPRWRAFEFSIDVPADPACKGQELRVFHDARSASEQLISGDVWFDDIKIERVFGNRQATQFKPGQN